MKFTVALLVYLLPAAALAGEDRVSTSHPMCGSNAEMIMHMRDHHQLEFLWQGLIQGVTLRVYENSTTGKWWTTAQKYQEPECKYSFGTESKRAVR